MAFPVLVIAPWRRRSPEELSLGTARGRRRSSARRSAPSRRSPWPGRRRSGGDAAQAGEATDTPTQARTQPPRRSRGRERRDAHARPPPRHRLLVGDPQAAFLEALSGSQRSCACVQAEPSQTSPLAQEQLAEAVAGAHQVTARVLAGAHEVAGSLLRARWHAHRRELAEAQQPRQAQASRRSVLTRSPGAFAIFEGRPRGRGPAPPRRHAPSRSLWAPPRRRPTPTLPAPAARHELRGA